MLIEDTADARSTTEPAGESEGEEGLPYAADAITRSVATAAMLYSGGGPGEYSGRAGATYVWLIYLTDTEKRAVPKESIH